MNGYPWLERGSLVGNEQLALRTNKPCGCSVSFGSGVQGFIRAREEGDGWERAHGQGHI